MTARRFDAALFDLDGTLIDSTALILASYRHTLRQFGLSEPDRDTLVAGFGIPLPANLERLHPDADATTLERMMEVYTAFNADHHDDMVAPFDGVSGVLRELRDAGIKLAVVTGKRAKYTHRGLQQCELTAFFDVVITPESTERHKPAPEPALAALSALEVAPGRALMVGDSPHDINCGRAAGTATAGAMWGPTPEALQSAQPDTLCESIVELLPLILVR